MANAPRQPNRYAALIEKIFLDRYMPGATEVVFVRTDLDAAASALGVALPRNLGDVIYSVRYRSSLPQAMLRTQPQGMEWVIEGTGRASYAMKLVPANRIVPNPNLVMTKVPNGTPEIISAYAQSDEQALLAKVRYNRLLDIFLGIACYSLQNHLRTTVRGIGQIEIDELYVGIDRFGKQYVLPVQAKGGSDQLGVVQTKQDIRCCAEKFPDLICRPVAAQFMGDDQIALFELSLQDDHVRVVDERHYTLVARDLITAADLSEYNKRS